MKGKGVRKINFPLFTSSQCEGLLKATITPELFHFLKDTKADQPKGHNPSHMASPQYL